MPVKSCSVGRKIAYIIPVMGRLHSAILVIDNNTETIELVRRTLKGAGFSVYGVSHTGDAIALLSETPIDLVITDLDPSGMSGLDLVRYVHQNVPETEIMVMSDRVSVVHAVEAVKRGADQYLVKPFDADDLLLAVRNALENRTAVRLARGRERTGPLDDYGLLGDSIPMKGIYRAIEKAATTSATVLITGESGTGKELVARAIHYSGPRASATFVPVNCGGIPEGLLESELFGYVKGSFTGATESRAGFFQTADGGTIFLDEIAETSLSMQVKLLRVLQDGEVYMVGANKSRRVDVRVLAATNKDLHTLVKKGLFREDLFFRLSVIMVAVPPLRERGEDILQLAEYFVAKYAEEQGRPAPHFSPDALDALRHYNWPGNVRELENVVQRLVVMNENDTIGVSELPSLMRFPAPRPGGLLRSIAEVEAEHIGNVLSKVGGNKTRAAEILGIDRKTLREKLKRYRIEPE